MLKGNEVLLSKGDEVLIVSRCKYNGYKGIITGFSIFNDVRVSILLSGYPEVYFWPSDLMLVRGANTYV